MTQRAGRQGNVINGFLGFEPSHEIIIRLSDKVCSIVTEVLDRRARLKYHTFPFSLTSLSDDSSAVDGKAKSSPKFGRDASRSCSKSKPFAKGKAKSPTVAQAASLK